MKKKKKVEHVKDSKVNRMRSLLKTKKNGF